VGVPGARSEIWAYGLRNAWRFSFDARTGELWAGDVGQNLFESVHVVRRGGNHGWNLVEGFHRFALPEGQTLPADIVPAVYEYPQPVGLSVTGGYVYRGAALPELDGWYVFADYVNRWIAAIRRADDGGVEWMSLGTAPQTVSSFAQGQAGELLVITHIGDGGIYRLAPEPE